MVIFLKTGRAYLIGNFMDGYLIPIEKKSGRITFEILQGYFCNLYKKAKNRIRDNRHLPGRVPISVFAAHYLKTNVKDDNREGAFSRGEPISGVGIGSATLRASYLQTVTSQIINCTFFHLLL